MFRRAIVKKNPGRGVPLRYSTSWHLHFWRGLPPKFDKLTFSIAPRLILSGVLGSARAGPRFCSSMLHELWFLSYVSCFTIVFWLHAGGSGRKVDEGLPGKENFNSHGETPNTHGARPVHLIITMIKWIWTSRLSIKNSLSSRIRKNGSALLFECA